VLYANWSKKYECQNLCFIFNLKIIFEIDKEVCEDIIK
jgi:hypothetical protein